MLSVTIETALLAPPVENPTRDDVLLFVDNLRNWSRSSGGPTVKILRSRFATEVLVDSQRYPSYRALEELLSQTGVKGLYDARTLFMWIGKFLNCPEAETYLQVSDFLGEGLLLDPDVYSGCTPEALRKDCERTVVIAAIARSGEGATHTNHAVASSRCGGRVLVAATLHDLEHGRNDLPALQTLPADFAGDCLLCATVEDYLRELDELSLWTGSVDLSEMHTSIGVKVLKLREERGACARWSDLPKFRLAPDFRDSVEALRALRNPTMARKVLRAAAQAVDHQDMGATHELREGQGPNEPQQTRGRDAAWRRDIDDEYHLHYWECGDGAVELACIGPHNSYWIPY
jgi:hypothetical protein